MYILKLAKKEDWEEWNGDPNAYYEANPSYIFGLLLILEERGLNKEDNGKNFTPILFIYWEILHFEIRGISVITSNFSYEILSFS